MKARLTGLLISNFTNQSAILANILLNVTTQTRTRTQYMKNSWDSSAKISLKSGVDVLYKVSVAIIKLPY